MCVHARARMDGLTASSRFCQAYIEGTTGACEDEVVAICKVTAYLFEYGPRYWSINQLRPLPLHTHTHAR